MDSGDDCGFTIERCLTMNSTEKLGARVRTYREKLGLSVEDLAKNSGLDLEVVRRTESGEAYPPISVLIRLSRALGQRLGTFMDDQFVADPLIIRAAERNEETASHKDGATGNYHYYPLGKNKTDRHMEPLYIRIDPSEGRSLSSHEGEEFIIVLSGEVELIYGKETQVLQAGDSLYYNSLVPHHIGAKGPGPAEIYAVIYIPI
jgi:transcriptional regulator with XRE-family HTH domain